MGLEDLNKDSGNAEQSNGGGARRYTRISLEEFQEFMDSLPYDFTADLPENTIEVVFETDEAVIFEKDVVLRVYSTIDSRTGLSRDHGADAIRTVLWSKDLDKPVGGRTKTMRITTWRKNLRKKIESIMDETSEYVNRCDECNGFLVKRDGKYGEFLGCVNYPECNNTEEIE